MKMVWPQVIPDRHAPALVEPRKELINFYVLWRILGLERIVDICEQHDPGLVFLAP